MIDLLLVAIGVFFWSSSLSFFPIPWPDDASFFLAGQDWVRSGIYRMHSQSPWMPIFDSVNFNTMPGLPALFGLGWKLGISGDHWIRVFGVICFSLWAICLAFWMRKRNVAWGWIWLLALGAIFSPVARWGAMAVRPEVWECLVWVLILMELDGALKPSKWRIPALLALGAYIHYEAILWVPPLMMGLYPLGDESPWRARFARWWSRLWSVAWRTLLLFSGWIVYFLLHFRVFFEQMGHQFGRVGGSNLWYNSWLTYFHSFFISSGNPFDYPKYDNAGEILIRRAWFRGVLGCVYRAIRERKRAGVFLAAGFAQVLTIWLWMDRFEVWFIMMIHMTCWTMLAALAPFSRRRFFAAVVFAGIFALSLIQATVTAQQYWTTRNLVSWPRYEKWVDCIESDIGSSKSVWQPHFPDVLVELASRNPERDYYRAVDFHGLDDLVHRHASKTDAIVHTLMLEYGSPGSEVVYAGPPRERDVYLLDGYPYLSYNETAQVRSPAVREVRICQQGMFWASVSLKKGKL